AGLQNFLRTMSGAVTTSLVTTLWDDKTTHMHAELAGLADRTGDLLNSLTAAGAPFDAALARLNALVQGESVMIATNQIMLLVALAFALAAAVIWLAPKPARTVDLAKTGAH